MMNSGLLKIKKHYLIGGLKNTWEKVCVVNCHVKPTQYYSYFRFLSVAFYSNHLMSHWRVLYFHFSNGVDDCIVPLVINEKKRLIRGMSNYGRLDYEDVISSTNDKDFLYEGLKAAFGRYEGYEIQIENVNESSLLYGLFGQKMEWFEKCVSIDMTDSYDHYVSTLSKHQRQNIRTAYNKIQKESFDIRLVQYDAHHPISHDLWKKCQIMYEQRHGSKGSCWRLWKERQLNPYTHILHSAEGWRILVLFHNEEPISYVAGLYSENQNCYYVPRLCINNQFSRYSPGIVLLNEVVKVLIDEGVRYFDLMRGDEPYKTAMGGFVHNNYKLRCKVEELLD